MGLEINDEDGSENIFNSVPNGDDERAHSWDNNNDNKNHGSEDIDDDTDSDSDSEDSDLDIECDDDTNHGLGPMDTEDDNRRPISPQAGQKHPHCDWNLLTRY